MKLEYQILIIIVIHWVADFVLQSEAMGTQKSKSNFWLLLHVSIYSAVWMAIGLFFFPSLAVIKFTIVTFIAHFITDYCTSRLTGKYYTAKKFYGFPGFWTTIGFDQVLHYTQLIICYTYFTTA